MSPYGAVVARLTVNTAAYMLARSVLKGGGVAKRVEARKPFGGCRVYGPYGNQGKRKIVHVLRPDGTRVGMDYGRYLMQVHLGRFLRKDEHVDHIDNDPSNNGLVNLQVLSPSENRRKDSRPAAMLDLVCPECAGAFRRERRNVVHKGSKRAFCSRSCAAKFYHKRRRALGSMV